MCIAWRYAQHMSTMLQVRNVPDKTHRVLKSRAAFAGMSLSDYVLRELERIAERPSLEELSARLESREPVIAAETPAEALRKERDAR